MEDSAKTVAKSTSINTRVISSAYLRVETLRKYLWRHLGDIAIKESDTKPFLSYVDSFCVASQTTDDRRSFPPDCILNTSHLLALVVERLLKKQPAAKNLLCQGWRPASENEKAQVSGPTTVEMVDSGTTATGTLTSKYWRRLHERMGDALLMHLLEHHSLYKKLPNSSLLQVTGPPLYEHVKGLPPYKYTVRKGRKTPQQCQQTTDKESVKSKTGASASRARRRRIRQKNRKRMAKERQVTGNVNVSE